MRQKIHTLTLCGDNGIIATLEGTWKRSNSLLVEMLSWKSSLESYKFDNIFQYSVKETKKLGKYPKIKVFAVKL